ncbi:hypothetical protein RHGRI_033480 [Rhododendron griersonianum]|uniref:Jacalin-type lectin domain-containing protein n=1 Tax=Rhododendron griersonianum TaxID=479676 RepID=A0AAV6HWW9_9ERIC|nr:hypothetical protein RHGRI_033480 [Rhododendron griersonianum]
MVGWRWSDGGVMMTVSGGGGVVVVQWWRCGGGGGGSGMVVVGWSGGGGGGGVGSGGGLERWWWCSEEQLLSISLMYEEFRGEGTIVSLCFNTNLRKYGPFGSRTGTSSVSIPIEGGVFAGFHGRVGTYLTAIDKFFEFYADIPEEKEVKYAAHKLYGYVSTWWERLQSNRLRQYKQPIRTWPRMRRLISDRFLQSNRGQELYQEYRRKLKSKQMFRDNFDVQYSHVTADTNYSRNMPMSLTQLSFGSQKKNQVPSSSSQSFHNYYDGYEVAEEEGDRVEFSDKDEVGDEEEIGSAEDCLSVPTVEQQFDLDRGATNEVIVREDENISISYQVQELKGEESHELVHIISQHVNTISNIELCEPHGGDFLDDMLEEESDKIFLDTNLSPFQLEIDWESPPKFDEYPDEEEVVIHEVEENVKDEPMKEIIAEENIVPVAGKIARAEPMNALIGALNIASFLVVIVEDN